MSVLDGFEAVGEKITTNKMTMTVMESSVRFSKGVTEALGCPAYVKLLVNDKQKKIAVQACDAKDENAIKFCKTKRSKADGVDSDAAGKASSVTVRTTDVLVAVQKYFTFPPVADDQIAYFAMNGESYPDEKVVTFCCGRCRKRCVRQAWSPQRFTSYSQRWRVSEQYSAQLEKSHIVQFS